MIKKIDCGKTSFKDLHQVFKYTTREEFESKHSRLFPNGNSDNEVALLLYFYQLYALLKSIERSFYLRLV